jgi:pimeloyl-ACP methyl ester carboxylesterase
VSETVEHAGCKLSFEIVGEGPPVLLVQGVGVQGAGWQPQTRALAERYTCLTFDNRGLGRSQPAGAPIRVEQLADDALALLDAAGWESAHVVGHSLGGSIALELVLRAPARARSLALLCTFPGGRMAAPLSARMLWHGARSRIGPRGSRRRGFLGLVLPPGALSPADVDGWSARLADLFGHDLADQPPIVAEQLRALRAWEAGPRLAQLGGRPTLVVSATRDPIAPPRAGRALAAGIPGALYREIPDASHGLPITHAGLVNELLDTHFRGAA